MPTPLDQRFLDLPPTPVWPAISQTKILSNRMIDLDGDGRADLPAFTAAQLCNYLGVLSFFDAAEMSNAWESMVPRQQMIGAAMTAGVQNVWQPSASDFVLPCNFRPGQGHDLLVVQDDTVVVVRWESIQQPNLPPAMQLNLHWSAKYLIPGANGLQPWEVTQYTTFNVADIDGDGADEVILYDGDRTLGFARWQNDALVLVYSSGAAPIPSILSDDVSFLPPVGTSFHAVDLNGSGQLNLVGYMGNSLAVLQWFGKCFYILKLVTQYVPPVAGEGNSAWELLPGDVLRFADMDGDGCQEIVLSSDSYLGLAKFDSGTLKMLGTSHGTIAGEKSFWDLLPGQQTWPARLSPGKAQSLVVQNGNAIGVLQWSAAQRQFVTDFYAKSIGGEASHPWIPDSSDQMSFGDVDGDGLDELVMVSQRNRSVGLFRWDGTQVSSVSIFTSTDDRKHLLPTWGIGLLASAPATSFPLYTGVSLDIYRQMSLALTGKNDDIRSLYLLQAESTNLANWSASLRDAAPDEAGWHWMADYTGEEYTTLTGIFQSVSMEMQAAVAVLDQNTNVKSVIDAMQTQRLSDLDTVRKQLQYTVAPKSSLGYWVGVLLEVMVAGLAVIPVADPIVAISMAAGSSFLGGLVGAVSASIPETTIDYGDLATNVGEEAQTAKDASDKQTASFLTDPVKLVFLQSLLTTTFSQSVDSVGKIVAAASPLNRLSFYESLIRLVYNLWVWNQISPYPTDPNSLDWADLNPPSCCIWSWPFAECITVINVLAPQSATVGDGTYAPCELMTDLFSKIGITPQQFLDPVGRFALPVQAQPAQPAWPAYIYATNNSTNAIVTNLYTIDDDTQIHTQEIMPGQTYIFDSKYIIWGSVYELHAYPGDIQTRLHLWEDSGYAVAFNGTSWYSVA